VVDGDPRTDTRAAAAHLLSVLWASASQGVTVKELRAAIGLSRERLETAYEYLLEHPPLGLAIQRHGDELRLVTAPEVAKSIERHLGNPSPGQESSSSVARPATAPWTPCSIADDRAQRAPTPGDGAGVPRLHGLARPGRSAAA
jgi:hypothetical protein